MSFENGQEYSALFEFSEGEFSLLATIVYDESLDYSAAYEFSEGEFPLLGTVYYDETLDYSAAYEFSDSDFSLLSLNLTFDPGQNISIFALPPYIGDDTQIITYESHKPESPPNLSATALSTTEIALSWTDNNPDEEGFSIERKKAGEDFSLLATVEKDVTSYIDGTCESNTEYTYRVTVIYSFEYTDRSNEASATTLTPPPLPPTNLVATAVSATQIDLLWQDNTSGEEGFSIERKKLDGAFSVIASVLPDTTTYIDDGLESDTEYTYRVSAIYTPVNTDYSNEASATTLEQPKWIKAYPEIGGIYDREVDVYLKMDRNTTCYYVVLPIESDAPNSHQIIAGTDAFDVKLNIKQKGSTVLTGNVEKRITIPYLTQETRYRLYFAANRN